MGLMTWLGRWGTAMAALFGAAPARHQTSEWPGGGRVVEPLVETPAPQPVPVHVPPSPAGPPKPLLDHEAVAAFFAGFGNDTRPWQRGASLADAPALPADLATRSIAEAFDRATWDPVTPMAPTLTAADEAAAAQATEHAERQRAQMGTATVSGFFSPARWQG